MIIQAITYSCESLIWKGFRRYPFGKPFIAGSFRLSIAALSEKSMIGS